ncbi:Glycosyl transferase family 2 [Anaerovibrio lipolyticus DSM 3074]|uniref:Glycosyl transferase family 2 n=1 Tax=Anaerovibrio lipolyticus DSM 3074 TaxID=1120997 RepID=A0A1M6G4I9_9FIRM|nr:glycosyltransferase family 2 protein [Anaerovibrio lipolyticus]SHJ04869.1 Glycosyl transferase family 2 [Anaerovibrio lipolyticus DSM 3074]
MELVSIIVTIYNKSQYLPECLESIKRQTYKNIEVVLIDDGSIDQSADICNEYVEKDSRFVYYYQENAGQNAARKLGLEKAKGEWIISVDADDFVSVDICEKFIDAYKMTSADMIFGRIQKYQNGQLKGIMKSIEGIYAGVDAVERFMMPHFFSFGIPTGMYPILYRKKVLQDFFSIIDLRINYSEDCACTLFSLLKSKKVCFISNVVYFYRQNDDSFCHSHKKTNVFSQKLLQEFLLHLFQPHAGINSGDKIIRWLIVRDLLLGGYEYFADYSGIYPYCEVPTGNRIAIYGAGVLGEEIYEKLSSKYICAGWFDREAEYYQKNGKKVSSPEEINEELFDYILIAVTNPDTSKQIATELKRKMKTPEKVLTISERIIDSEYTFTKLKELEKVSEKYIVEH